jgi:DNA-binding transcriptional LysR family regulator
MTFHQLEIFSVLARHQNLTKAARVLRISQPTVTHQMSLLSYEVGRLYKRTPQGIRLTANGSRLFDAIQPLLRQMDEILVTFGRKQREKNFAPLVVGGSTGPSAWLIPSIASQFRAMHPTVDMTLKVGSSTALEMMVQEGEIEIAIVTHTSNLPGVVYEPCRREELVFFAARQGPFVRTELSISEFAAIPLVVFKHGTAGAALKMLQTVKKAGSTANIAIRCESVDGVKTAVRDGAGLGMLYRDNLRNEIDRGEVQLVHVTGLDMQIDSSIAYVREKPLSAAATVFLDLLRSAVQSVKLLPMNVSRAVTHLVLLGLSFPGIIYSLVGRTMEDGGFLLSTIC